MAFSFDTLVEDQKQSAIDIVDTITPAQIKQVGDAYKAGLNASPKQVINETLEKFTGIDLSQGAGVGGLGNAAKEFVKGQAADLTMQLQQQILGCINTQIRDLMNKIPEIDFLLNFEDRINGILGNFRNKLEFKIDAEFRKLAYKKFKVHQVSLFKQRIRGKIKDICPGSAPASVAEVQDFNNKVKGFIEKRKSQNKIIETETTLPSTEITTSGTGITSDIRSTPKTGLDNKMVRDLKAQPGAKEALATNRTAELNSVVDEEMVAQSKPSSEKPLPAYLDSDTNEDVAAKRWASFSHYVARIESFQNDGAFHNDSNVESTMMVATPHLIKSMTEAASKGVDEMEKHAPERKRIVDTLNEGDQLLQLTARSLSYNKDSITGQKKAQISWEFSISEKREKFPVAWHHSNGSKTILGSTFSDANTKALAAIEDDIQKGTISMLKFLNA